MELGYDQNGRILYETDWSSIALRLTQRSDGAFFVDLVWRQRGQSQHTMPIQSFGSTLSGFTFAERQRCYDALLEAADVMIAGILGEPFA